ncbi:hypothetical protein ILYODFUR_028278, partial [Ilyodon furcidens]
MKVHDFNSQHLTPPYSIQQEGVGIKEDEFIAKNGILGSCFCKSSDRKETKSEKMDQIEIKQHS